MHILIINAWSSSIKYRIFQFPKKITIINGEIKNIWQKNNIWEHDNQIINTKINNHNSWFNYILNRIKEEKIQIDLIWHRVVHGWDQYSQATKINKDVIKNIKKFAIFAPQHNPINIEGILSCQTFFKWITQIAIFDTSFHQSMKAEHFLYSIPYKFYKKYKIRRYGFHWISHKYLYQKTLEIYKQTNKTKPKKIITCHIGNGASITAIKNGKVIENSLGMSTNSGLMMWTRSGDIDPSIVTFLMKKEKISPEQIEDILYNKSWILGISEETEHLWIIVKNHKNWDKKATLALKCYINSITKYLWAYTALLNWVDTIIFSGWVLEKSCKESAYIREKILENLQFLQLNIDNKKNKKQFNNYQTITTDNSKIQIIIIPTNEELMIAKESYKLIKQSKLKI